jgi:molybdopterin-containing oxidoreductase family membrane subunit
MEILDNINTLSQCLFGGFQITILCLFVLKLIFKQKAALWSDLFLLSNCILLFTALLSGIDFIIYQIVSFKYSDLHNPESPFYGFGIFWYGYWIIIISRIIAPHILWIRKFRRSYRASLCFALLLFIIGPLFERLIIIATNSYKDYLPSSWTYYGPDPMEIIFTFSLFVFILMTVYFFSRKRLKSLKLNS